VSWVCIREQANIHRTDSFEDELYRLLREGGIDFDERYLV